MNTSHYSNITQILFLGILVGFLQVCLADPPPESKPTGKPAINLNPSDPFCGPVKVKKVTRITHPDYTAGNQFLGGMRPWNSDYTRILVFEGTTTHPVTKAVGKGYCWGFTEELKAWKTREEYEKARKPLSNQDWILFSVFWSPIPGEENMIYGVRRKVGDVIKLNTDTGEITSILKIDGNVTKSVGRGWSKDLTLLINAVERDSKPCTVEIDVKKKTQQVIETVGETQFWDSDQKMESAAANMTGGNHSDISGTRKWFYAYRGLTPPAGKQRTVGGAWSLTQRGQSVFEPDGKCFIPDLGHDVGIVTVSFAHYADSWIMGVDLGDPQNVLEPTVSTYTICQIMFYPGQKPSFVYRPILKHKGAAMWYENEESRKVGQASPGAHLNYHSLCKLRSRRDGKQMVFFGVDGAYTWQDHLDRKVEPWDNNGMFLADLEPDPEGVPTVATAPFSSELRGDSNIKPASFGYPKN